MHFERLCIYRGSIYRGCIYRGSTVVTLDTRVKQLRLERTPTDEIFSLPLTLAQCAWSTSSIS